MKKSEKIRIGGKILLEVLREALECAKALDREIGSLDYVCEPISRAIADVKWALEQQIYIWEALEEAKEQGYEPTGAYGQGLIDPRYTGD